MEDMSKSLIVVKQLKNILKLMKRNMGHQFDQMDLTHSQGMLMGILCHFGKMKVSDLSDKLGLSNSTVSGIIDRLEKQGHVERVRSNEDKRVVYVNATEEFVNKFKGSFKETEKRIEDMVNKATSEELDTILKGLETLERIISSESEE